MDDSVLWAVALGTGMFGLMLLTLAGAIVVYWRTVAHRPGRDATVDKKPPREGKITAAEKERAPASSAAEQAVTVQSPWLWVKAWLFAVLHATTVSLVVGGITFFEDLTKAGAEIQRVGTVSFPKQLLPETISGSTASRKRISRPPSESPEAGKDSEAQKLDRPLAEEEAWEVVDNLVGEVGIGGD